jgi:hypothetical protein
MPTNMDTTNAWLAVMAIAIVVQTLLMVGAAIGVFVAVRRTTETLQRLEDRHLAPLSARVNAVADDVQEVITRVRRADDGVRAGLSKLDTAAHLAGHAIGVKAWPVIGLTRAVAAAVRSLSSPRSSTSPSTPSTTPASPAEPRLARITTR